MKKYLSFQEYVKLHEMPITGFHKLGNWEGENPTKFGYSKADIGYVTNKQKIEKLYTAWNKTKYNFEIYLISSKKGNHNRFHSDEINPQKIKDKLDLDIQAKPDAITIILTTNAGEKVIPLTPWMIAHRAGHAILTHNELFNHNYEFIFSDLIYIIASQIKYENGYAEEENSDKINFLVSDVIIPHEIGTMQAAKKIKIQNVYEFYYDLFAQYIITNKITFNKFPEIINLEKYYEHPTLTNMQRELLFNMNKTIEFDDDFVENANAYIKEDREKIINLFNKILNYAVGKIFMD